MLSLRRLIQQGFTAALFGLMVISCDQASQITAPIVSRHDGIPAPDSSYRLTVSRWPGSTLLRVTRDTLDSTRVVRLDTLRDTTVASGTRFEYLAHVDSTHEALSVTIDSIVATDSGSLTMDRDHAIQSVASMSLVLPAGSALLQSSFTALQSGTAGAGLHDVLRQYGTLVSQVGTVEAHRRFLIAERIAFPLERTQDLRNVLLSLSAEDIDTTPAIPSIVVPPPPGARLPRPTQVFYINGVLSGLDKVIATQGMLEDLRGIAGVGSVSYVYNHSWEVLSLGSFTCLRGINLFPLLRIATGGLVADLSTCPFVGDFFESAKQIANISTGYPLAPQAEALALADSIVKYTALGQRVIVIAHSQGNLMAQEALSTVGRLRPTAQACLGVVSIAPPTVGFPVIGEEHRHVMVAGQYTKDILLHLPGNSWSTIASNKSAATDLQYLAVQPDGASNWLDRTAVQGFRLYLDYSLHGIDEYLDGQPTGTMIGAEVQEERTALASTCRGPVATLVLPIDSAAIALGDTLRLTPTSRDEYGDTVAAPLYTWQSRDTTVASVANGLIMARGLGSTIVVTSLNGIADSTVITVYTLAPPAARLTYSPSQPLVGQSVEFNGSSSTGAPGDSLTYQWDWGDSSAGTGRVGVTHAFTATGSYTVTLRVTNQWGQSDSTKAIVNVYGYSSPGLFRTDGWSNYSQVSYWQVDGDLFLNYGSQKTIAIPPAAGTVSGSWGARLAVRTSPGTDVVSVVNGNRRFNFTLSHYVTNATAAGRTFDVCLTFTQTSVQVSMAQYVSSCMASAPTAKYPGHAVAQLVKLTWQNL